MAMSGCTGENSWRGSAARAPEVEVVPLGEPSGMNGWLGPQSGLVWLRLREWDGSWWSLSLRARERLWCSVVLGGRSRFAVGCSWGACVLAAWAVTSFRRGMSDEQGTVGLSGRFGERGLLMGRGQVWCEVRWRCVAGGGRFGDRGVLEDEWDGSW